MNCGQCGAEIMLGAAVCERCGWSPLGTPSAPVAPDLGGADPFVGGEQPAPPPPPPAPAPPAPTTARPAPPPPPPPGFQPPPPPPPGYAPPPQGFAAPGAPGAAGAPGAQPTPPQGGSSGCGCLGLIVVISLALAAGGAFFALRGAGDAVDGIRDAFDIDDFREFEGDRVDAPPVSPGADGERHGLDDQEIAVHPLDGIAGRVAITVSGEGSFDPFIRVERADGQVLGENDDGGEGRSSLLVIEVPDEPGVVLLVREFGGRSGDYRVAVVDAPDGADGRALSAGTPVEGFVALAGARVDHRFTGTGQPVVITASSSAGFDPIITVVDAAGAQVARNDDFPGRGSDARVELTVAAGTEVVVQVSGFGSSTGAYVLTAEPPG